jgi:hypothetical protein
VWAETYSAAAPGGNPGTIMQADVIETGPDWSTHNAWSNGSCTNPPQSRLSRGRGEDGTDWITVVGSSSGPGLSNLCFLPVGRHTLPEHPIHITRSGETSPFEMPNTT